MSFSEERANDILSEKNEDVSLVRDTSPKGRERRLNYGKAYPIEGFSKDGDEIHWALSDVVRDS